MVAQGRARTASVPRRAQWGAMDPQDPTSRPESDDTPATAGSPDTPATQAGQDADAESRPAAGPVEQPATVMRIGTMVKQLLDEVRSAPLDEAARTRMQQIHARSIAELEKGLAPELQEELRRLVLPLSADPVPSDAELRVAQAQLVGWLEGLFHGIQTAIMAQQVAAKAQQQQQMQQQMMRRLPPGAGGHDGPGPLPGTGQYL